MKPIAVIATGMVTGVGLTAPSTCAAIHCAIDNFAETRFIDSGGEWIVASEVPLDPPVRGRAKLIKMAAPAIMECLSAIKSSVPVSVPLLLCLGEEDRPGRFADLDGSMLTDIATVIATGRPSGMAATASATATRNICAGARTSTKARTRAPTIQTHQTDHITTAPAAS